MTGYESDAMFWGTVFGALGWFVLLPALLGAVGWLWRRRNGGAR